MKQWFLLPKQYEDDDDDDDDELSARVPGLLTVRAT